jgi:hypothetical protein
MGRAELLSALATCDEHLAQNEQNISDQERRVTAQEAAGHDTAASSALLRTFKQLRHSHLTRHAAILRDLAALTQSGARPS